MDYIRREPNSRALRYTYLFNDIQVFSDTLRERDNIVWRVAKGVDIFPLVHDGKCEGGTSSVPFEELRISNVDDGTGVYRFKVCERRTLDRDYFLHDDNLHRIIMSPGRLLGLDTRNALIQDQIIDRESVKYYGIDVRVNFFESLYAYKFPKPFYTPEHGWVVGFLVHDRNVIAHDVDMENNDDDDQIL